MIIVPYTDKGKVRNVNEDSIFVPFGRHKTSNLVAIADGMGGHRAGKVASDIAINSVRDAFATLAEIEISPARKIRRAIRAANEAIYRKAASDDELKGMGTTIVMALLYDSYIAVGHVGDSRAYLYRNNMFQRLTTDHSLVEELISLGELEREDSDNYPYRNVITRALGTFNTVKIDTCVVDWQKGDRLVLCSDGLTTHLNDAELEALLKGASGIDKIAGIMVDQALERGGTDNISVIIVQND